MGVREMKSFCRICPGFCGIRVTLDDDRIVAVHGDKSHPITAGYICSKANLAIDMHHGESRLLHPLRRKDDGTFERIGLEEALDEIAGKLQDIIDSSSVDAIAMYRGTANGLNTTATASSMAFLQAIGSTQNYSSMTIDQSAKWVTAGRLGAWGAGRQHMDHSDVLMLFGSNPLVSLLGGLNNFAPLNPVKRIRDARARGMKLIVIDPRRTETAAHADVFLQPYPGEDVTIAAGMIRLILTNGWHDAEFCAAYGEGLDELKAAVDAFTPDYVARRAGIAVGDLEEAARVFALESRTGAAGSGTGPNMAYRSNLAEHLIETLNVVCGRYARAGDPVANWGALSAPTPVYAQVIAPTRPWEQGPRSKARDVGTLYGERMSGVLAGDILTSGPDKIRALISAGGNPASALPDQRNAVAALEELELLVAVEPFMSTTAQLAHYILPTKLLHERFDLPPTGYYERALYHRPFAQLAVPLISPPEGSEVVDDWYIYWSLAKRLGKSLSINGEPLDRDVPPRTEDIMARQLRGARISFEELRQSPDGILPEETGEVVEPAQDGASGRFQLLPSDVAAELEEVAGEAVASEDIQDFPYRLTVRRLREVVNTTGHDLPNVKRRKPYNAAYLHPAELEKLGVASGDIAHMQSDYAGFDVIVEADESMRQGVVAMSHGWGKLPGQNADPREGVCTNLMVRTDIRVEKINAMPAMSAIPVRITVLGNQPMGSDQWRLPT
ncbi:Anaerobic selenocysteine-containing dehydrogenase [Sphingobium faniae]|nr:Anaerobic selenocysteine-containing dehydrogenase [Sphingobium faniae]